MSTLPCSSVLLFQRKYSTTIVSINSCSTCEAYCIAWKLRHRNCSYLLMGLIIMAILWHNAKASSYVVHKNPYSKFKSWIQPNLTRLVAKFFTGWFGACVNEYWEFSYWISWYGMNLWCKSNQCAMDTAR